MRSAIDSADASVMRTGAVSAVAQVESVRLADDVDADDDVAVAGEIGGMGRLQRGRLVQAGGKQQHGMATGRGRRGRGGG